MRFMAARSVAEGRRAVLFVALVMMPIAACVVASAADGLPGALVHAGVLPDLEPKTRRSTSLPSSCVGQGLFGLIIAALTAALMSTVDYAGNRCRRRWCRQRPLPATTSVPHADARGNCYGCGPGVCVRGDGDRGVRSSRCSCPVRLDLRRPRGVHRGRYSADWW